MSERRVMQLAGDDEVSRWVAALTDARSRTLELLEPLSDADLEKGEPNTIGSVVYHLALIEADWLHDDIREQPDAISKELFPYEHREQDGILTPVKAMTLHEHLERLATVRRELVEHIRTLDLESFHRLRSRPGHDVSPAWVLHHLLQHEAEHRAEIGRALAT